MNRKILARFLAVIPFAVAGWLAYTQAPATQLKINKVKDDLFEIENDGGNVAVYVTNEGVILIDDKFDADHDQIVSLVKTVTPQPIKYILSTHYHQDHSGGNGKFLGSAQIISTDMARKNILNKVQQGNVAPPPVQPASVTFNDEMSVFLGGKEVRAKHFGRGHTNTDAVMYFPALRTIHTGDLMAGNTPLIDYPGGGSVVEWTKTLDKAMALDFDTVIPGHGAVTTKAALKEYRDNVEKLKNRAQGLIRQGKSEDEVFQVMVTEFNWAPNGLQKQWSTPGMMKELK